MTHNFVTSYTYDLPFQRLFHASGGAAGRLMGGWDISGIARFTTGLAMGVYESGDLSLAGTAGSTYNGVDLPNYSGRPIQFSNPRSSANHQYFSSDPFSTEQIGMPGNSNRRFFHGPGLNNWDMALHKTTRITERTSLEFRAEFFNLFNHAQFMNPVGDFASSEFGQVIAAGAPRIGQMALKLSF